MLAFAMAGHGQVVKATFDKTEINLNVYATRQSDGAINIVAINKDPTREATIECPVPAGLSSAKVYRLSGPSLEAKSKVTFRPERRWTRLEPGMPGLGEFAHISVRRCSYRTASCERRGRKI